MSVMTPGMSGRIQPATFLGGISITFSAAQSPEGFLKNLRRVQAKGEDGSFLVKFLSSPWAETGAQAEFNSCPSAHARSTC